ncbi:hypothetical protein [Kumtagia ephedrae]|uniref:Cell envelope integrity protein TolA n=1 Tax=Kumtagia ephedrae TaxID=2116701 RepID=A0A2P7RSK9_9HYPH|nr:hypothetical protein [Mesorhizobium ephedrae]PSJ53183.1 hypothetical protein C7I84_25745 [Mesorhizobium ephedrae]
MKRSSLSAAIFAGVLLGWNSPSRAEPLQTMDAVGAALQACWTAPAGAGKSSVTLSFSFKRDGSLMGPPKPTAIAVEGDDNARKAFVGAAIAAVEKCTPLSFSPAIADGIAGGVYTMQFTSQDE